MPLNWYQRGMCYHDLGNMHKTTLNCMTIPHVASTIYMLLLGVLQFTGAHLKAAPIVPCSHNASMLSL